MTHAAPAVALLFDDTDLGGQLREALQERGARIVHEGGVSSLSRQLLQEVGADVLVINLDDAADDALDRLYEVIDGDRPSVVFNDAQASRALAGWDRARWARHLAVKVLAAGDIDPPRPEHAPGVEVAQVAPDERASARDETPVEVTHAVESAVEPAVAAAAAPAESSFEPDLPARDGADEQHEKITSAASENLAAELEALLASGDLPSDEEEGSGSGLRYADTDDLPPLHDGNFGTPEMMTDYLSVDAVSPNAGGAAKKQVGMASPAVQTDHLQLSALSDFGVATIPAAAAEPLPVVPATSARAPEGWALLDDEATLSTPVIAGKPDASAFGVEKMSAAAFLAPAVEQAAPGVEPVMSLELVSMEEAIAPQAYQHTSEMLLDELGTALSQIILLGAAVGSTDSVCTFLAELPASTRLTFLLVQHAGEPPATLLVKLAAHCPLPVRLAEQGGRAQLGEVLVVPVGQQVRLRRDGGIEVQAGGTDAAQGPSIDASFTMAANAFGRGAVAIVFSGRGTDAVAGSQAIHDRGGQVWVESSSEAYSADIVSGIFAERLVSFSGTPHELAAHLIEVFP